MRTFVWAVFAATCAASVGIQAQSPSGSMIVAEGFAAANTYAGPLPGFFASWCADAADGSTCIPTVALDVFEPKKERSVGTVYAWGKDFRTTAAGSLQFKEFILFDLQEGQLYTLSQDGGHPGGAFADPTLVIPKQGDVVLVGGAEGWWLVGPASTATPGDRTRRG